MKRFAYLAGIAATLLCNPSYALDGRDVMKNMLNVIYYQGNDQRARAHMQIIDKQGRERVRELTLLRRNSGADDGKQQYYVYFSKPSDVKKMIFMAWKNVNQDDDRWLYLPALDLVRRIAASDERTSFVGSHFFYEDVSGRGLDEDTHDLVSEDDTYYIIKSTPKNPGSVEFSNYQAWIDKKTSLPMKIEYYNNNAVYRAYQILKFDYVDGYPTVITAQMEDNQTGGKTLIHYSAIKYELGLPENIFTERYLRRPARKYLR